MSQEEEEDDEEHLSRRLVKAKSLLGSSPSQLSSGQLPPVLISGDS